MECATTALPSRCVLVSGRLDFLGKGPFGAQNFLRLRRACGGSAHGTVAMDPESETPPSTEHPRHLPGGGRHPGVCAGVLCNRASVFLFGSRDFSTKP